MNNIRYASIRELDISNGENVGVALFVQGCPFHCYNCFNPETWDFNGGKEWIEETKNKFVELANKPYIKRISILGGEPLADENLDDVLELVNEIRLSFPNKSIWLYTGYEFDYLFGDTRLWNMLEEEQNRKRKRIISKCTVMVDGKYMDSKRDITLKWRGSSNQRVIDIQKTLQQDKVILWTD